MPRARPLHWRCQKRRFSPSPCSRSWSGPIPSRPATLGRAEEGKKEGEGQGRAGQGRAGAVDATAVKNLLLPVARTEGEFLTEGTETRASRRPTDISVARNLKNWHKEEADGDYEDDDAKAQEKSR